MAGDPPIIISGGSITIEFADSHFKPDAGKKGKFKNTDKQIKRIEISGGGVAAYDQSVTGNDIVIKIHYGNP
jgi:hypothetical protein